MQKLSDIQFEAVMNIVIRLYDHTKLTKSKREQFLVSVRSCLLDYLVADDVCSECMGTGRKNRGK